MNFKGACKIMGGEVEEDECVLPKTSYKNKSLCEELDGQLKDGMCRVGKEELKQFIVRKDEHS